MPAATKKSESEVEKGYAVVVSPLGPETIVPDEIVDALVNSGYTVK